MNFSLRRFLFFSKEHSELCDWEKDKKIPRKNIKHAKVLIFIVKVHLNGEFIEVPYSIILQESDAEARIWYENEAANEMWSMRTLQRNISSQCYHRLLKSQNQDVVREEMKQKTFSMQDKLEFIKNPVIAER